MEVQALDPEKTIKYITVYVTPFNGVGDPVQSKVHHKRSQAKLKATGPMSASDGALSFFWDNVWYNSTITCIVVDRVDVEYYAAQSYTYVKELPGILSEPDRNTCAYGGGG